MGDEEEELPELPSKYSLTPDGSTDEKPTSTGFSGKATARYTNGDVYEGLFDNGKRQGAGKYTYRNGDVFEGTFERNLKTGLGRMTYKIKGGRKSYYHGYFKDGKREGEGTFQYANGDIYSGFWSKDKREGKGTYVFNTTKYSYEGVWKDGQIVSGTWSLTDGTKYVGNFAMQKPLGDGVWKTAKGTAVEGAYVQQVLPIDKAPPAKDGEVPATETRTFWKTVSMVGVDVGDVDGDE